MVLWIPRPPDNANARQHWGKAASVKRTYLRELAKRVSARLIPAPPATPIACARITAEWWYAPPTSRRLDEDNAVRRLKPVIDWLVTYGYLAGDTPDHVTSLPPIQTLGPPPREAPPLSSVRLTLTPLTS